MSRELLKRALEVIDQAEIYAENENKAIALYQAIETYLAQPEPEPVAWAIFRKGTMYDFSRTQPGEELLGQMGDYAIPVYTTPPDQSAQIAELTQHLKDAHAENAKFCQIIEKQTKQLAALQATREPLSDDEIRDCAESENLPYFENKEEFDAFARAIEAAHNIGVNHE